MCNSSFDMIEGIKKLPELNIGLFYHSEKLYF